MKPIKNISMLSLATVVTFNIYAGNGLKKSENKYHPQQFKGKSEFLKYKSRG